MCRRADIALPPEPTSPMLARRFVEGRCARWFLDAVAHDLALLISELVTNSVLHARTPVNVSLSVGSGEVEVDVYDGDPRPPVSPPQRRDVLRDLGAATVSLQPVPSYDDREAGTSGGLTTGRGLVIVEAVSDAWGIAERSTGKEVWFQLAVPSTWPYLTDCRCGAANGEAVGSGRRVVAIAGPWSEEWDGSE